MEFSVRSGFEGPQIITAWDDLPANTDLIRLLRRKGDYAQSITGGVVLLNEAAGIRTAYSDVTVEPLDLYYYCLFIHNSVSGVWGNPSEARGKALAFETGNHERRLWSLMSPIDRNLDRET